MDPLGRSPKLAEVGDRLLHEQGCCGNDCTVCRSAAARTSRPATPDRLLTAHELGEYLGLSSSTVLDRFERGDLPGFRLFGRKGGPVRFRLSEIEAQLEGWRVN